MDGLQNHPDHLLKEKERAKANLKSIGKYIFRIGTSTVLHHLHLNTLISLH